ncbi:MAG: right-handed parallel beta-helix repeat-containing protein [Planctomycetes bacterium]|nr:right-handed parallel beta-helix repeat-containing protein [Planctomycetota bacterium]
MSNNNENKDKSEQIPDEKMPIEKQEGVDNSTDAKDDVEDVEIVQDETKPEDTEMTNYSEEQDSNNELHDTSKELSAKQNLSENIDYVEDDDEYNSHLSDASHLELSDKDLNYTAYDDETEMNVHDPILNGSHSQIIELEIYREKAQMRARSTTDVKLAIELTEENTQQITQFYKDLKWAVLGKKKNVCLKIMYQIMRINPFDPSLTDFIKIFPDLYDETSEEVHQQIIDFMKFDSQDAKLMIVDANNTGDFASVSEAIKNANSDDIIIVMQSEYEESLVIDNKDITLRGLTETQKPVLKFNDGVVLILKNTKSNITNIEFEQLGGEELASVDIIDCSPIVENCVISSKSQSGIHINGRNALPMIRYNKISNASFGLHIENQSRPAIKLNEIKDCKKEGIKVDKVSDPNVNQNLIINNFVGIAIHGASKGVYYRNELIANKRENIFVSKDSKPELKDNKIVTYFKFHLPELRKALEAEEIDKAREIWKQIKDLADYEPRLLDIISKYPELDPEYFEEIQKQDKLIKKEDFEWDLEPEEMALRESVTEMTDAEDIEESAESKTEPVEEIIDVEKQEEEKRKLEEENERQRKVMQIKEENELQNKILEEAKRIARERLEIVAPDLEITGDVYLVDHDIKGAFDSIQDAVNQAQDDDFVLISPREYNEDLYIHNKTVNLVGEKIEFAPLLKRIDGSCLRFMNSNSTVLNIDFKQAGEGNFYAIDISGCSPTIENCTITCESIAGIGIHNKNADPLILNNKFEKGTTGVKISKSAKGKIIGNEFTGCDKAAISITSEADPTVSNNLINETFAGIQIANKARGRFEENLIDNTTKPGISISNESQCDVSGNIISNLDVGIQIAGHSWASLENNEINNTHKIGIASTKNAEVVVTRNSIKDAHIGIQFTESSNGTVDNNEILRCTKIDLLISEDCAVEVGHNTTKSIVEDTIEKMKLNIENGEFDEAAAKWVNIFELEYHNPIVKEVLLSYPDFEPEYKKQIRAKLIATEDADKSATFGYIWVVDRRDVTDRDFVSIQAAVQKATENDIIFVKPSVYEETIIINRKHLSIIGEEGDFLPKINVEGDFCIRARNTKSMFKNLEINQLGGGNYYTVDISDCAPIFENCHITSQSLACVGVSGVESNPTIRNNKLSGGTSGIAVTNSALCLIEDNEIFETSNAGIVINNEAEAKIFRNIIRDIKSTGINAYNTAFANIEDNEIRDCDIAGIAINNQCDLVIKNNKIVRGGIGIIVKDNSKCEINSNEIEKCLETGITINNQSESEIVGNSIRRCKKSAVHVSGESSANIIENEIIKNTKDQIIVNKGSNPLIKNNTIKGGKFTGISIFEECKPIIDENEITENEKAGIQINENSEAEILRNKISYNSTGIIVLQQSVALIQENEIFYNEQACIEVFFDSDPVIKNNNLHEGKLFGIIMRRHSKGRIFENRIWNNEKVGIRINDGANPEIRDNLIYDNKWNGIKVHKNGLGIVENNEIYNNKVGIRIEEPDFEIGENNLHDNIKNDVIRID